MIPAMLNDHLNKMDFTEKDLHPSAGVKRALNLIDKCFMELYSSILSYPCAQFLTIPPLLVVAVGNQANNVP